MHSKFWLGALCLLLSQFGLSQEIIFEKQFSAKPIKGGGRNLNSNDPNFLEPTGHTYPIWEEDGSFSLVFYAKSHLKFMRFDKQFQMTDSLDHTFATPIRGRSLISGFKKEGKYHLYFRDERSKEVLIRTVDLKNKKCNEGEIEMIPRGESFVGTFVYGGEFYVMTVIETESLLKLYILDGVQPIREKRVELKGKIRGISDLHRLLMNGEGEAQYTRTCATTTISPEVPLFLGSASSQNKFYIRGDRLFLTMDARLDKTHVLEINMTDLQTEYRSFEKPSLKEEAYVSISSNSILFENRLYQTKINKNELKLSIRDWDTGELIKTFQSDGNKSLPFASSPVYHKGGVLDYEMIEISNTKTAMKRILKDDIGIYVVSGPMPNTVAITLGGYVEINRSGGNPNSAGYGTNVKLQPLESFDSDRLYRTTYFSTMLSTDNWEKHPEPLGKALYTRIEDYMDKVRANVGSEFLIKVGDGYRHGCYDPTEKKYFIRKF